MIIRNYFVLPAALLIFSACIKRHNIEFTGTADGVKNGVFIIKTIGDSTLYGENIKDGKFSIPPKTLKYPGYYLMNITDEDNKDQHNPFEVYLDNGKYEIATKAGQLYRYPKITSSSAIQQQLSAFYTLSDQLSADLQTEIAFLNHQIKEKGNAMSQLEYTQLLNKLTAAEIQLTSNDVTAFKQFIKQYPGSEIGAHIMARLNYEDDPVSFNQLYQSLLPAAKNSDEGKEIGGKLAHLVKLVEGATAPAINGNTPDGKSFDPKALGKPYILVDFWRASNDFSRRNHQKLIQLLRDNNNGSKLAIISVSMDTRKDWWLNAINEDNMSWTQVSDLKGDDSPNAANWSITQLPTYYLLDQNWKVLKRNIEIGSIDLEVQDYLNKKR